MQNGSGNGGELLYAESTCFACLLACIMGYCFKVPSLFILKKVSALMYSLLKLFLRDGNKFSRMMRVNS